MTLLRTQCMNRLNQIGITGKCLEGGCRIGLQQVGDIALLLIQIALLNQSFRRVRMSAAADQPDSKTSKGGLG